MTYTYLKCVRLISSPLNHGSLKVGRDSDAPSPPRYSINKRCWNPTTSTFLPRTAKDEKRKPENPDSTVLLGSSKKLENLQRFLWKGFHMVSHHGFMNRLNIKKKNFVHIYIYIYVYLSTSESWTGFLPSTVCIEPCLNQPWRQFLISWNLLTTSSEPQPNGTGGFSETVFFLRAPKTIKITGKDAKMLVWGVFLVCGV